MTYIIVDDERCAPHSRIRYESKVRFVKIIFCAVVFQHRLQLIFFRGPMVRSWSTSSGKRSFESHRRRLDRPLRTVLAYNLAYNVLLRPCSKRGHCQV